MPGKTNALAYVAYILPAITALLSLIRELVKKDQIASPRQTEQKRTTPKPLREKLQGKKQNLSPWKVIIALLIAVPGLLISFANFTLIAKSYRYPDRVPTFMGVAPLIVLSDSMAPTFQNNDLIFIKKAAAEELNVYDIIAFHPAGGTTVVTHRIIEIGEEDGSWAFITKGDANIIADVDAVHADQVVGKYRGHIGSAGASLIFLYSPLGNVFLMLLNFSTLSLLAIIVLIYFLKRKQTRNEQAA